MKEPQEQDNLSKSKGDFEKDLSRQERLEGARKLKIEDISFDSEVHNIYDPFFSSESSCSSSDQSYGSESEDSSSTSSDEDG